MTNINLDKIKALMDMLPEIFDADDIKDLIMTKDDLVTFISKKLIRPEVIKTLREIYNEFPYSVTSIKKINVCLECGKPSVVLSYYLDLENIDIMDAGFCKNCFKKRYPDYTLEKHCASCPICFKCDTQKALFTEKEIENFRKKIYNGNELKLI